VSSAVKAASVYFAGVFAIGFLLGTIRVLAIAPRVGELIAVCIELPIMIAASWLICRWSLRRFAVSAAPEQRIAMGAIAFAMLMTAEFCMAVFAFDQRPSGYAADLQSTAGMVGFGGQVLFGLLPLLLNVRRDS
jgi:hypothetical protein